ncbi:thioredoxin family protein [Blastopirellula sp. JC732]|uniref:Thioredoxin family protein n=1 Tax=Blastopirellula sediminis TaxID=2894196 RepID=A0A9X1MMD1_9BACT|nr:thioredoxin family protein [Blastopirellula sediminis]MCC9607241.1 thioredoxin family protein [Blastopirellula sediminis]MCC9629466.1 thioredoxin family protein [Blastopirellula sediminis]
MFPRTASLIALCCFASLLSAGEYNPVKNIGDKAPEWKELPGVDGKKHSLADLAAKEVIVVAFTCNTCPYAVDYEDRLNKLAAKYAAADSPVAVVSINCNLTADDSLDAMKERAEEKKFAFAYLTDASQESGKQFGATRTPEFFVLNKKREIVYMGALDDSTDTDKAKTNYVQLAIDAALQGQRPEKTETIAIGCNIRYKRSRR